VKASDKYEVIGQVGQGGMGVVYKVRHRTLETILALKVLPAEFAEDPEVVRRFYQEARVMAQLNHPNIVRVLDVDKDGNTPYFVMEYIEGRNLGQVLREHGPLPLVEVLALSRQVARALDYAHSHEPSVIHRDVKPENILIEERSGRAVVTDFGIAKVLGAGGKTRTGLMLGTLLYCAPEQILQHEELDGRADIYSLGLVMYEMVTRRPFFADLDERALLGRVLYGPGENVPTFTEPVAPEFVTLITRAIAREPERRYQRAADLLRDIETCLERLSHTTPTVRLPDPGSLSTETARTPAPQETRPQTEKGTFLRWLRKPGLRARLAISLSLLAAALFFNRLVSSFQTKSGETVRQSEAVPLSPTPGLEKGQVWEAELRVPRSEPVVEESASGPVGTEGAEAPPVIPQLVEQPFSPPRRYRATVLTVVRDKPMWTGREIARVRPNTKILVVASIGDWLKVKSRSNPPKPSGYIWRADVREELRR
jgi:serine/threonine-protein kinase